MIIELLSKHGIAFERVDHPPVFTCEEAGRLVPKLPGAKTKNLFLRDGKGKRHILLSVPSEKTVNLKALGALLEVSGLGFASPERLKKYLGVEPGSVTILALVNDSSHAVEVVLDEELWGAAALLCHPLINTATLSIGAEGIRKFLSVTGHTPRVLQINSAS